MNKMISDLLIISRNWTRAKYVYFKTLIFG